MKSALPVIVRLDLVRLRNEEHYQYASEFRQLASNLKPGAAFNLGPAWDAFKTAFASEESSLEKLRKSDTTAVLQSADKERDRLYVGLSMAINAAVHGPAADKVADARRLQTLLKNYGNPVNMPQQQESGALTNLLIDLKNETYAPLCTNIGVSTHVAALEKANGDFDRLYNQRAREDAAHKEFPAVNKARQAVDAALHDMFDLCDVQAKMEPGGTHMAFIKALNPISEREVQKLHARQLHNEAKKKTPAPATAPSAP